jgi:hypothetical protein
MDDSKNNEPDSDVSDVPSVDEKGAPVARWLRDIQKEEKRKLRQAKSNKEKPNDEEVSEQ